MELLEPLRRSGDVSAFGGRRQVFAAGDGTWAIWFAVLDKERSGGVTVNGCYTLGAADGRRDRYSYFAVAHNALADPALFRDGTVYLAAAADFPRAHDLPFPAPAPYATVAIEEYGSDHPVRPLARLRVTPADFPHRDRVYGCDLGPLSARFENDFDNLPWLADREVYPVRPADS